MSYLLRILLVYVLLFNASTIWMAEVYFDRIELLNSSYVENVYKVYEFRVAKFNRTTYVLNADCELFYDTDQNHTAEFAFYYNRLNNNQYTKSLIRVPKDSLCNIADKYYATFAMDSVKNRSNLPQLQPGEKYCPFKMVMAIFFISAL